MKNSKRILVNLLAQEGVEVIVGNFPTASFNLKDRVLKMPDFAENEVLDMLIGHEVAHAIWSGDETILDKISREMFDIFNVLEDVRIEKLIQNKYPGFKKIFKQAYNELNNKDFFSIKGKSVEKLNFIDRLNLKAKLQDLIDVDFSPKEKELLIESNLTETLDDVIELTKRIYEYLKKDFPPQETKPEQDDGETTSQSEDEKTEQDDGEESFKNEESDNEKDIENNESKSVELEKSDDSDLDDFQEQTEIEETNETSSNDLSDGIVIHSETQKNFDEKLKNEMIESFDSKIKDVYFQKDLIKNITSVHDVCYFFENFIDKKILKTNKEKFGLAKKTIQKEALLVFNEFNRKKSAKEYSKEKTSKTGTLDVNKMFSYRYNEDIFLRNTIKPQGKNHYLYMLVDMSGSMAGKNFKESIRQTLVLSDFCKLAGIPFKVVGFSCSKNQIKIENNSYFHNKESFQADLTELISSDCSKKQYDFLKSVYLGFNYFYFENAVNKELTKKIDSKKLLKTFRFSSSTPTFEALVGAKIHIDHLKTKHHNALFSLIILTDGESNYSRYGSNNYGGGTVVHINNQKIKFSNYEFNGNFGVRKLLSNIDGLYSKSYIFLNFDPKNLNKTLNNITDLPFETIKKSISEYRKNKTMTIDNISGLKRILAINTNKLDKNVVITENSSSSQLKQYVSGLTNKSNIKKFFARKIAEIVS
jgi:hypothetical protein